MERIFVIAAGVLGLLGVLAGTVGAHVLAGRIEPEMLARFETGAKYHMYHTLALLATAVLASRLPGKLTGAAGVLFIIGIVLFSGSLYIYATTGQRWLAQITPIGGFAFMFGWVALVLAGVMGARGQ